MVGLFSQIYGKSLPLELYLKYGSAFFQALNFNKIIKILIKKSS